MSPLPIQRRRTSLSVPRGSLALVHNSPQSVIISMVSVQLSSHQHPHCLCRHCFLKVFKCPRYHICHCIPYTRTFSQVNSNDMNGTWGVHAAGNCVCPTSNHECPVCLQHGVRVSPQSHFASFLLNTPSTTHRRLGPPRSQYQNKIKYTIIL